MEVEVVSDSLLWIASRHMPSSSQFSALATKGERRNPAGMCQRSTFIFKNLCGCINCSWHAGLKGNERAVRLAGKVTISKGLHLGWSEMLKSLRHYLRAQSQGHHIIDRVEERGVKRASARQSSLKRTREGHRQSSLKRTREGHRQSSLKRTREGRRQSDEHWNRFKGNVGETSQRKIMGFSEHIDTILNWTELWFFPWMTWFSPYMCIL